MAYSPTQRTGFEAALARASRDLLAAAQHADDAGDEGAVEDLTSIRLTLEAMRGRSQHERRSAALPKPIAGQTAISVPGEAPGASEPSQKPSRRRR
jgi:hypothetical protein